MNKTSCAYMPTMVLILIISATCISFSQNLELIGTYYPSSFIPNDIEISGNYLYLGGNNENGGGFLVLDVSNPAIPLLIGQLPPSTNIENFTISGNYVYANFSSPPLFRVIDIQNAAAPLIVGSYSGSGQGCDICKSGNIVYIIGTAGLIILDVTNPINPTLLYHDSLLIQYSDLVVSGSVLYVGGGSGINYYDISDPASISLLGNLPGEVSDICIRNNVLYTTYNGVDYYQLGSMTSLINVLNPLAPQYLGSSGIGGYEMGISGEFAFIASQSLINPIFEARIDVLDISHPPNIELASHENNGYNGFGMYSLAVKNDTLFVANSNTLHPGLSIYRLLYPERGALAGYILDCFNNLPVKNAIVSIPHSNLADTCDSQGYFIFNGLYNISYNLEIGYPGYYTKLDTGFTVSGNDTSVYTILLNRPTRKDVGIAAIISPFLQIKVDSVYCLRAQIKNYGTETAYSIQSIYEVYYKNAADPFVSDTQYLDSLVSGGNQIITFADSLCVTLDTLVDLVSYTIFTGDENSSNDTCVKINGTSPGVDVWYGNPYGTPIFAGINDSLFIDVYVRTRPYAFIGSIALILGTNDLYIDSLLSRQYGHIYYPLNNWDDASFLSPQHSPPNPTGWSSQAFVGFYDIGGAPNPNLHYESPTKILAMAVHIVDDTSLIGDTIEAIGPGVSSTMGHSSAGDIIGESHSVREHFCPIVIQPPCIYVLGDINGDGHSIGGDVTYAVRYFKSQGPPPVDSCYMDSTGVWFYPAGDVNGNCEFRGSDVSRMVAFFKSTASLSYCHFFPPR